MPQDELFKSACSAVTGAGSFVTGGRGVLRASRLGGSKLIKEQVTQLFEHRDQTERIGGFSQNIVLAAKVLSGRFNLVLIQSEVHKIFEIVLLPEVVARFLIDPAGFRE